jgi:hypothetical protein
MTIVSLRGTHGSGKSYVAFAILRRYATTPVWLGPPRGKPHGYVASLPSGPLFLVGSYETPCGGCDGIQPYSDIWPRIEHAAEQNIDVLFEGALVSSSYGNIGRSLEQYGDDVIFAFLDTPLEVCLTRIAQRRAARGDARPLNPHNTEFKFNAVAKSLPKIRDEFRRQVTTIRHTHAVKDTLALFGVKLAKEPKWS